MPEEFPDQTVAAPSPDDQLTYADVLARPDLHPGLRPHVEQLAAGAVLPAETTTETQLVETVTEAADGRSVEITSEHHEKHLAVAGFVPGIEAMTPDKQDLAGELVEIGQEAIQDDKNDELDRSLWSLSEDRQMTIKELRTQGISAETLLANGDTWYGGSLVTFADKYKTMVEDSVDPDLTQTLATKLLKCRGINLLQQDSEVFTELASKPAEWAAVIDTISTRWPEATENGFPKELASDLALGSFNYYSIANSFQNMKEGERYEQYALRHTEAYFDAIDLVGTSGLDVSKAHHFSGPKDGFISGTAYRLMQGESVDAVTVKTALENFQATIEEIQKANPQLLELSQKIGYSISKPEDLILLTHALRGVGSRAEALKALSTDEHDYEGVVMSILNSSVSDAYLTKITDHEPDESEMMAGADTAINLYDQENRYPKKVYKLITGLKGEAANEYADKLLTPSLRAYMDNEHGLTEVQLATFALLRDGLDIGALVDAQKAVTSPLLGMMEGLALAQPTGNKDEIAEYYQLVKDHINALDKNGTPYNSPQALAETAALINRGNEADQATLTWYMTDTVPFGAFSAVAKNRQLLVARGVQDTPSAIYEAYSRDPALIAEMSQEYLIDYLAGDLPMSSDNGRLQRYVDKEKVPELIEHARSEAEARQEAFRIFVNVGEGILLSAAQNGGQLKSILDTDAVNPEKLAERGARYVFHRSDIELMMGNRSQGSDAHPIYGSCGYVDRGIALGAYGYGNVLLTFKPAEGGLKDRTTFTPEDSFHGTHRLTESDARTLRIIKNGMLQNDTDSTHAVTSEYVEAQITGGVDLALVDEIVVPNQQVADRLKTQLPPELASRVVSRDHKGVYDATAEQQSMQPYVKA